MKKPKKKKHIFHHFYAWLRRKFWTTCPRCGQVFGGHQKYQENVTFIDVPKPVQTYRVVCHRCAKEAQQRLLGYEIHKKEKPNG